MDPNFWQCSQLKCSAFTFLCFFLCKISADIDDFHQEPIHRRDIGMSRPLKYAFPLTHRPHPDPTPIVGAWYCMKHSKCTCISEQKDSPPPHIELHQVRSSVFTQMHFKGPSTLASPSLVFIHLEALVIKEAPSTTVLCAPWAPFSTSRKFSFSIIPIWSKQILGHLFKEHGQISENYSLIVFLLSVDLRLVFCVLEL